MCTKVLHCTHTMTKALTTRLQEWTVAKIEKAAQDAHIDKTAFVRIIIEKGLREFEEEKLLKRYQKEEISLGKLAEELGITKWDAHALLQRKGIYIPYDIHDLDDDRSAL